MDIIKPENIDIVPCFCPECNFPFRYREDSEAYRKYKMCYLCSISPGTDKLSKEYQEKKYLSCRPNFILK